MPTSVADYSSAETSQNPAGHNLHTLPPRVNKNVTLNPGYKAQRVYSKSVLESVLDWSGVGWS